MNVATAYPLPPFQFNQRTESLTPTDYRLVRRPGKELVLQGCFPWTEGTIGGSEWRDLPTVELK